MNAGLMVFDNCQIDVFFHMRSHYNRLRKVQSVVDCSRPKALQRITCSEPSFQHVEMVYLPGHGYGVKKHNCGYGQLNDLLLSGADPSSKTKGLDLRPKTRRHPEDSPPRMPEKYSSRSSGNRSSPSSTKCCIIDHQNGENKYRKTESNVKKNISTIPISYSGARISYSVRNPPTDELGAREKFAQPKPHEEHTETKKNASSSTTTETAAPLKNTTNARIEEHEYLQFLLRITEDIIKNDLYTNKDMKKVFSNHIRANCERLELDRMLLRVHELMKELNIPLDIERDEKDSPSWADIAATMRGLLCLEERKAQEDHNKQQSPGKSPMKEKSITFDLRATYPIQNDDGEEEMDNLNYSQTAKFKTSLDRLTERTEPLSSRATCKTSTTFSNFGDVDILPGFECLETPKISKATLCELCCKKQKKNKCFMTIFRPKVIKKMPKIKKRKLKRRKRRKHTKNIYEFGKANLKIIRYTNQDTQCDAECIKNKLSTSKFNEKPIIIVLKERERGKDSGQVGSNCRNYKGDYIFIDGPVYLLKRFLDENPQTLLENETTTTCPISAKSPTTTTMTSTSSREQEVEEDQGTVGNEEMESLCDKNLKDLEKGEEETQSVAEKEEKNYFDDIFLELTNFSMSNDKEFLYFDVNDGCGIKDLEEGSKSLHLCSKTCPRKSSCSRLRLADKWHEEYDLTPEKERKESLIPPDIIRNFLTTREIQTEDIFVGPTIVGLALVSEDDSTDTDLADDVSSRASQKQMQTGGAAQPPTDYFKFEREIKEPTKLNMLLMASDHQDAKPEGYGSRSSDKLQKLSDPKVPLVSSLQTNGTLNTFASTATVERAQQYLGIEDEMLRMNVSPLFSKAPDSIDESDNRHQRKVSILKNPVVQVPMEKIFGETEDSKKKQESIIRTVESLKDRQAARDPYLDKVLQEIESSRETRAPEKMVSADASEKSEHVAVPGPSALKNTRPSFYSSQQSASESSTEDIPVKMASVDHRDAAMGIAGMPVNSDVSSNATSEQNFLSLLDEQADLRGSPSQIRQINKVTAKLDQFRHSNDKDEAEITATLDKLVETLKNQQDVEEDVQQNTDESDEKKSDTTVKKKRLSCCGFCTKKKPAPAIPFNEPLQLNNFSEQDYKAKSEAFELALASLGQKQKPSDVEDHRERIKSEEDNEQKSNEYGPSPIVHSGNRLSLVRIVGEKENDIETMNADFEVISTKISNDRLRHM